MYFAQNQYRIVLKVEKSGSKWLQVGERRNDCYVYGRIWTYNRAKGRIIVPAKFRESLGDNFIITKGLDNCLFVYTNEEWQRFEEKLKTLPLTNKNARTFTRFFLAGAADVELDKQGRILIPSVLREFASLQKDVVFVGVGSRIEIWSKESWNDSISNYDDNMDEVAENMDSLGFTI